MQLRYEGTNRDAQADKMAPVSHARGQELSCCHAYGMQRTLPILFHPMPVTLKCHIQHEQRWKSYGTEDSRRIGPRNTTNIFANSSKVLRGKCFLRQNAAIHLLGTRDNGPNQLCVHLISCCWQCPIVLLEGDNCAINFSSYMSSVSFVWLQNSHSNKIVSSQLNELET